MMGDEHELGLRWQGLVAPCGVLKGEIDWMDETYYFLNSAQGRAAVQAIENGEWQETKTDSPSILQ
jgi:hypothetical protein